jgi:hypothetical protein
LLVLASLMLISCSCADFGFVLDGDGMVVLPNFHPTYNDGTDRVESERVTEKETRERRTNARTNGLRTTLSTGTDV